MFANSHLVAFVSCCLVIMYSTHGHDEDPFHDVDEYLESVKPESKSNITATETEHIIRILWNRMQCDTIDFTNTNTSCQECLPVESLFTIVDADMKYGLNVPQFHQASVVLLYYVTDLGTVCKTILDPSAKDYDYFSQSLLDYDSDSDPNRHTYHEFQNVIEDINATYVATNYAKCFTAESAYNESTMANHKIGADADELAELSTITVSYLVFGYCIGEPSKIDTDSFLWEIFKVYGEDGYISLHSLEHMLEDLGIGEEEELHSHSLSIHRQRRDLNLQDSYNTMEAEEDDVAYKTSHGCYSASELFGMFSINHTIGANEDEFLEMSPSLLQQILSGVCHPESEPIESASAEMFLYGTVAVLVICLCSFLGILTIPVIGKTFYNKLMQTLIALSVSTMSADALLHLIPHSGDGHGHSHHHVPSLDQGNNIREDTSIQMKNHVTKSESSADLVSGLSDDKTLEIIEEHFEDSKTKKKWWQYLNSLAVMVIIGDGLHNFADGLAIGAAFCIDVLTGVSTSIAVLCHELPHEFGDYAILVSTGMGYKRALLWNGISASFAFVGLYIGLVIGSIDGVSEWILAITAGMFLYIALADMTPQLTQYKSSTRGDNWLVFLWQNIGILTGFTIIFLLAYFEHAIEV
ncbi:metal cation symporter ZIP14-like [Saccoglossus kowalevskii]|uniref:Zinc transporter ZIP12-like n=1 Tax=Saccoglossus kowalevskii TaxID=10224 RepID=A0ABM0GLP0_SACKO|nr:PREDICTED: zinc transporter ZIP12-like [Saccoglossus kowalevskii]